MTLYKINHFQYNITLKMCNKEILVATIRTPLISMDEVFIDMCFPYDECSKITLNVKYLTEKEMLEKAKKIITKKLYNTQQDILAGIQSINFEEKKYKNKYTVPGNFARGNVYAEMDM